MASTAGSLPLAMLLLAFWLCGCGSKRADFIRVPTGTIALTHVRVIDGTGAPAKEDQTLIIEGSRIRELGDARTTQVTGINQILDLRGHTVFPGLVGMHDHLFYALPPGVAYRESLATFPKLYLGAGVTSVRTAGTINLSAEVELRRRIDAGAEVGPHLYLSSPYVDPAANSPEDPRTLVLQVEQWKRAGVNSIKVYIRARKSELAAVVESAHRNNMKVTGHLCAIGFTEAAKLGIDNLEHGLIEDTEFYSQRRPDTCPNGGNVHAELVRMEVEETPIQNLIRTLVKHHVALTSTLTVFESFCAWRPASRPSRPSALQLTMARSFWATPNGSAHWPKVKKLEGALRPATASPGAAPACALNARQTWWRSPPRIRARVQRSGFGVRWSPWLGRKPPAPGGPS